MVVNEVPAPALVVGAKKSDVAVALIRRFLGCDADDGNGAERPFPNNLPRVATANESRLAARPIGALQVMCAILLAIISGTDSFPIVTFEQDSFTIKKNPGTTTGSTYLFWQNLAITNMFEFPSVCIRFQSKHQLRE